MLTGKLRASRLERERWNYWLLLLPVVAVYYAYAIVAYPFPDCLSLIFWPPLLVIIFYDIRCGIVIWYVLSALGNMFVLDLPGIPPLRPAHLILLLLLGVWFVKSYETIPAAAARFLNTTKNKGLLILLGWIALSMVMGRLTGVTRMGVEYQFNAWFSVMLAICVPLLVSDHTDNRFLQSMIWVIVGLNTILTAIVLAAGVMQGVELHGWKTYVVEFVAATGLLFSQPLFILLVFFPEQKWWGKIVFGMAIVISLSLKVLMILGGSRSDLFLVVSLGFLLLITKPRLLIAFGLLIVLPVMILNASEIESWATEQFEYKITSESVAYGKGTRIALALDALRIIRKYPLWGTGSDFYRHYSNVWVWTRAGPGKSVPKPTSSAHNPWLQTAADHGISASILMALFLAFLAKDTVGLWHSLEHSMFKRYVLLFLAGLLAAIIESLFGVGGYVLPVFTVAEGGETATLAPYLLGFWLHYGIVLGIANRHKEQVERASTS